MDLPDIGQSVERLLRCSELLVEAFTPGAVTPDEGRHSAVINLFASSLGDLQKDWKRLWDRRKATSDPGQKTVCAKVWLDAHLDQQAFHKLESLLRHIKAQAAVAASRPARAAARYHACQVVFRIGQATFVLLHHASLMASDLMSKGSTAQDHRVGTSAMTALMGAGLITAVANAARAVASTVALLRSEAGSRQPTGLLYDTATASYWQDELAGSIAVAVCTYVHSLSETLFYRLADTGVCSFPPRTTAVPRELVAVFDGLEEGQLLAGAAALLVGSPPCDGDANRLPEAVHNHVCFSLQGASEHLVKAISFLRKMQDSLRGVGSAQCKRLSAGLLCAARQEAVQRLQVALLDQLAAHAGLGAKLQGEEQQGQQQGQRQRQGQGHQGTQGGRGWEGSSGTWRLACEEARQGKLLGMDAEGGEGSGEMTRSRTAGWLEDYHCHVVHVTVVDWHVASLYEQRSVPIGVLARPPPLLAARLAARAAESLCRLCRGQGLGGAYAPAPEWQLGMTQPLMLQMLLLGDASALAVSTARACLPHWMEAAAWVVALATDATAAHMGRLPSSKLPPKPRSMVAEIARDGSQADTLCTALKLLGRIAGDGSYGLKTLSAAAQADVRRRLHRCGLAASLDHALRLAFSAQDSGQTAMATELHPALMLIATLNSMSLAPMFPPAAASGGGGVSGGGRAEGGGGVAAASTCGEESQVGCLYTLSKRANMLARALEAWTGAAGVAAGDERRQGNALTRQQVTAWATQVLALLAAAVGGVEGDVRELVAAARREAVAGAVGGEGFAGHGSDAAWRADAECVDEAHEALALAAQAASNLAAPLAGALAADLAAAALASGRGRQLQLSQMQEMGIMCLCDFLRCAVQWWRYPLLLPPAQLMACQPHRLLAAACALAAALPNAMRTLKNRLGLQVSDLLTTVSAHKTLSSQVRSWLVSVPAPAGSASACSGSSGSEGGGLDTCAGCLAASVRSAVRHTLAPEAVIAEALLRAAEASTQSLGQGGPGGDADGEGEPDGGSFQRCAEAMAEAVWARMDNSPAPAGPEQGSLCRELIEQVLREYAEGGIVLLLPSAPVGALPPPLVLQPRRAGTLPRLRVCGNPRCSNFGGECEAGLALKKCGGCQAVRYCGAECQRAHWREGHRAECKALAAASEE